MEMREHELVTILSKQFSAIEEVQSLLKNLFKGTLEQMLETEMDEHPGVREA